MLTKRDFLKVLEFEFELAGLVKMTVPDDTAVHSSVMFDYSFPNWAHGVHRLVEQIKCDEGGQYYDIQVSLRGTIITLTASCGPIPGDSLRQSSIVAHVEARVNGHWEHYSPYPIENDNRIFASLGYNPDCWGIEPIAELRGLPHNLNSLTKYEYHNGGLDNHHCGCLFASELDGFVQTPKYADKVRLVFWFQG